MGERRLILDQIVEQSRLEWLQCRLLVAEKLRLGLAHLATFLRVAINWKAIQDEPH